SNGRNAAGRGASARRPLSPARRLRPAAPSIRPAELERPRHEKGTLMSDLAQLFEGKLTPLQFIEKEWANAVHLVEQLPAEVRPLGQALLSDAQAALSAAEAWTGTAVSAFLSANGGNLQTEILNLLSGLGAGAPERAAAQDILAAALKLL